MAQQALTKSCDRASAPVDSGEAVLSLAAFKIKRFRKKRGLTATQLAGELGVSQPAVIYWEKGQKCPRPAMQRKLQERGICSPNDWHKPAPVDVANDDGGESAD